MVIRSGLIPPAYVKPFVKRQKNDAADAEAICEAAQRPTMRFVVPKSEQTQAAALVFRARDLLVKQRTQIINALRGHLAEFGIVAAKGPARVPQLMRAVEDPDEPIPELARPVLQMLIETLRGLDEQIARLDHEIAQRAKENEAARRLMTIPGVGPVTAVALAALAPPAETFKRGRDFAAWVGLTPLQRSTGGKQKLGATSKNGRADLAPPADHRSEQCLGPGRPPWRSRRVVDRSHGRAETADAGSSGAGQQNGPHRLGAAGER